MVFNELLLDLLRICIIWYIRIISKAHQMAVIHKFLLLLFFLKLHFDGKIFSQFSITLENRKFYPNQLYFLNIYLYVCFFNLINVFAIIQKTTRQQRKKIKKYFYHAN